MSNRVQHYHGYRFPPESISHAVWLYYRFCLSFRDVEDLLAERGIIVSTRPSGSGVGSSVRSTRAPQVYTASGPSASRKNTLWCKFWAFGWEVHSKPMNVVKTPGS